jgi:5-methylcytosine-specific restriction endonuclease McrA
MPRGVYDHHNTTTPIYTDKRNKNVSKSKKGIKLSEQHKEKVRTANTNNPKRTGENHWNWKGGISPERKRLYFSQEYKLWRKTVFERDSFTCIWCGQVGGKLNADHIKPWSLYPELRFAIDNGRTLCECCHRATDTYGVHK